VGEEVDLDTQVQRLDEPKFGAIDRVEPSAPDDTPWLGIGDAEHYAAAAFVGDRRPIP
jgi:hypothetical protein